MFEFVALLTLALDTPCEYEDSTNCVWVASDQGNGAGQSFIDVDGTAYYFNLDS